MSKKSTLDLYEQAQNLTSALNNLDYRNEAEDAEFERLLIQMDTLEEALSGNAAAMVEIDKTNYHLQ